MNRLSRRVALWGGAAAIAAGGFAFMASNTVASSSAGEGQGTVSGYHVTNISYTVTTHYYGGTTAGGTADLGVSNAAYYGVTFTLTSTATTANANGQPKFVMAYAEKSNGGGHATFGHAGGCTATSAWTTNASNQGTGTYSCTFAPVIPAAKLGKLNVEANQ